MNVFKILTGAALILTATISSASEAWSFADQEPAAFASIYPDRDVLNGGALTPPGRMGLERPGGAAPVFAAGKRTTATSGDDEYLPDRRHEFVYRTPALRVRALTMGEVPATEH
ncbi:hypothetical protein P0R31_06930 [Bradyrhizobium yuanmingense]|uniref:hypothetical protein n=1 Tax=Bradyrhizobium yuanmingense TaxID=108015 RepID=UPI0023B94774|nr:hypothetical protein [Bradyrhizobium yuanmingense]MDF0516960.1 hypothetical protein [Bradyrhizobium yuanmingense]